MLAITAHALINIAIERTEPKVAAVSVVKLSFVLVGTIILWTPNFKIRKCPNGSSGSVP